jgi:hypothetical protein
MQTQRAFLAAIGLLLAVPLIAAQATGPTPQRLTEKEFQALRWIEGSWKGTGGGVAPFFERYRFESPTTLIVETLEGGKVTSTSKFTLVSGVLWSGSESGKSVATAFDATSVTFEFAATNRGSFRWQRETADSWKAILKYPASGNRLAGERVYLMERVK